MADPVQMRRITNEWMTNRDLRSKAAQQGSGVFNPQSKTKAMEEFVSTLNSYARELALELDLGPDPLLWNAFSELISSHAAFLNSLRK